MTHIEALNLERIPEHLMVLGAGYVGLELSQALRRFRSRVTLIARGRLASRRNDRILGFAAFGAEAGELMGTVQVAMPAGAALYNPEGRSIHPTDDVGGVQLPVLRCAECLTVQSAEGLETDALEGR